MIIVGVILLVLGLLTGLAILWWLGIVLIVIGLVLLLLSFRPVPEGGTRMRRWY